MNQANSVYPGEQFDFTHEGLNYVAKIEFDDSHGAPWEECDGFFPVERVNNYSAWRESKKPGQRCLYQGNRGEYSYVYDYAAAVQLAKRDGWGAKDGGKTSGQLAVESVESMAEFLRGWCADEWCFVGVIVRRANSKGEPIGEPESLWGVESCGDYARTEVAPELAEQIRDANQAARIERKAKFARKLSKLNASAWPMAVSASYRIFKG